MADPFDIAAQVVARQRAYGPIASTQYQDAAKAARVNQLARQAGLPADVVDADFANVEADQRVQQGQALASTTPQAAAWLAQPRNAAAVSNDYHGLTPLASALSSTADPKVLAAPQPNQSYLGSLWQGTKNLVGGLGQTLLSGGKQSYSALENVAGGIVAHTVDPLSALVGGGQLGARMQAQSRRIAATAQPSDTENYYNDWHYSDLWHNPGNFAHKVVPGNAFQMVRSLPMMAETMVGGGVPAAVDITEQTAQARARNNGRPSPSAWDYAISLPVGIISAALFRGARTGDVAAGVAAPVKPLVSSLAETALRDAAIGGSQAALQYTGETAGTDKGFSYGDMLSQSAQGAAGNAIFGVALHSASAAVATPIRRMRDVAVARDGVDYVDNIMDAAQRARSRQQSPEEFQSFVDAHVKDGPAENLYIPGEAVSVLFQTAEGEPSPRRIEQDPFWAKYAPAIDEAQRIGGDVVVPLSDIATHLAGSSDWNQLREQVRFNPGGMSLAEAREYSAKQAPEDIEKAVAELSGKMDAATGDLQALRKTYQFGRDLGLPHDQAVAFGAVQRDWIVRRNEIENAGRVARGEVPLTPGEEWDSLNLRPENSTEADFAKGPSEAAYAQRDREVLRRATPERQAATLDEGRTHAEEFIGKRLHNESTGLDAVVSKNSLAKMTSAKAVQKSSSPGDHALAVANADTLFARALLDETHPDRKASGPGEGHVAIHRYVAPLVTPEGLRAVKMTVKETRGAQANPLYTIETMEVEGVKPGSVPSDQKVQASAEANDLHVAPPGFSDHVRSMLQKIKDAHDRSRKHNDFSQTTRVAFEKREKARGTRTLGQLSQEPMAQLTGEEMVPAGTALATLKKAAKAMLKSFAARVIANPVVGDVRFGGRGQHKGAFTADEDVLRLTPAIPDILENSRDVTFQDVRDSGRKGKQGVLKYAYVRGVVDLAGEMKHVEVVLEQRADAHWYYSHRISGEARNEGPQTEGAAAGAGLGASSVSTNSASGLRSERDVDETPDRFNLRIHDPRETFYQSARGNISISKDGAGNPLSAVIRSFESANISTALHEMGHYWIEDLRARALSPVAPEELKADWQAVKDWFGENGHTLDQGEAIPEAAHELWARGVERYVMEGKAPSQRLAGAFARLAQWMRKLYQSVTTLNAPISPEIRGVMDRMLASNSEIEAARGDLKMNPLEGAEALMTESERAAYHNLAQESRNEAYQTLLERVMETVRNRRTREYNEQKRNVKDTVTGEVDAMPVHRALKLLRKGEDGERVKLPKQWLTDNYGENATDTLPKGVDPIWADEGHDPEEIADRSGFDNADQMVRALQDHATAKEALKAAGDKRSPRQALIDETTKQRIESDIPDPYQDIEQEARAAVANDKAGDLMSMEARALARKTGRTPTLWAKAKEWAVGHLQTQSVRDALTGAALARYSRSVAKAGKLTEEALYKGDFEQALTHKNQQILNAALLQEAKRVKEEVETASRKLKRIADARTMKSIDQDYLDQAHALLDQVRMGTETGKRVEKVKSFEKWYNEQVAEGREPIAPIEYSRLLGTVHWTSMKVGDLMELNDVVGQIVSLGRLKQKLLDGKEERDYEGAVGELVERQRENPRLRKQTSLNDPKNSGVERIKARFRSADAVMLKFEQLMSFMDNAQPNGPWQRMLMNPISAAQAKQSRLLRPLLEDIKGALTKVPKETLRSWTREVDTPELANWVAPHDDPRFGRPWRFTKDQLISMALNLGNDGNKQRLLDGYHFKEADVRAVLDRNLSAEEWRFVQDTWDTVGKLWPEIAEMERRVNGFAPEKVEPTPVETPHGTLEGGYFPAIYDPLYSSHAEVEEVQKLTGGGFFSVNTRAGATHERADQVKRPLLLSISTVTRHLNEVVHDIAFREPAAQVRRLLKDDRIKQAISNLMGPEYHKNSLEWLENVAKPKVADSKQNQTIMAFARALNKRITTAGLGFRLSTILQQPASFSNTMAEVGNVRYANFFAKYLSSPVESWKQVSELSEEMRDRAHNLDANINALYEQQAKNKLVVGPSKITELAFKGIAATDLFITVPGWLAAFDKATVDLKMNDDDAVHYADMVIRKTQGAGSTKDQAAIQRTAWLKAFNPFFSYWSAHYNQLRSIGHEARRVRDTDHVFNLANRFVLVAILPMAIQGWFFGGPQSTNADGSKESDVHYLLKAIMLGNMGAIPGVSAVTNAVGYGYPYKVSPWSRFFESAKQVGTDIQKGYSYEEGDGEAPKSWIKDSLDAFAYFSGKPTSQLGATLQGVYDYGTDKAHPETVGEWNDLLARGKVPQHDR